MSFTAATSNVGHSVDTAPDGLALAIDGLRHSDLVVRQSHEYPLPQLIDSLTQQWRRQHAGIAALLRTGVGEAALDEAAARLGFPLPGDARAWWKACDGVEPVACSGSATLPTVGPGGWMPLTLASAVHLVSSGRPVPWQHHVPMFSRDAQYLAMDESGVLMQVLLEPGMQGGWSIGFTTDLATLVAAWANALRATYSWSDQAEDWHCDPFSLRALHHRSLVS